MKRVTAIALAIGLIALVFFLSGLVSSKPQDDNAAAGLKPGEVYAFAIEASDPNNDELSFSASSLPDGATFNPDTQTFSWTPRYDQEGVYVIRFEVSDGQLSDYEDVTITVIQLYEDWDVNGDGVANILDIVLVAQRWGESGLTGWIIEDANEDGTINILDLILIGQHFL